MHPKMQYVQAVKRVTALLEAGPIHLAKRLAAIERALDNDDDDDDDHDDDDDGDDDDGDDDE